jgi:hypothetical protein
MLPEQQIVIRLVVAVVLGSAVGIERERLNWVAGLRTHMLVCVGATLYKLSRSYRLAGTFNPVSGIVQPAQFGSCDWSCYRECIDFCRAEGIFLLRQCVQLCRAECCPPIF